MPYTSQRRSDIIIIPVFNGEQYSRTYKKIKHSTILPELYLQETIKIPSMAIPNRKICNMFPCVTYGSLTCGLV